MKYCAYMCKWSSNWVSSLSHVLFLFFIPWQRTFHPFKFLLYWICHEGWPWNLIWRQRNNIWKKPVLSMTFFFWHELSNRDHSHDVSILCWKINQTQWPAKGHKEYFHAGMCMIVCREKIVLNKCLI